MTNYGTIPTNSDPNPNPNPNPNPDLDLISRAKSQIQSGLQAQRPWKEFFSLNSFSLPSSLTEAHLRARPNLVHFRANYAIIILLALFLSLLHHPISLIFLALIAAAWMFLYFLPHAPLVVLGRVVDDGAMLAVLAAVTVVFLLSADVTPTIVGAVAVGAVVVVAHAVVRKTDDLAVEGGFDEANQRLV